MFVRNFASSPRVLTAFRSTNSVLSTKLIVPCVQQTKVSHLCQTAGELSEPQVILEKLENENSGIYVLSLNRPKANALGKQLIHELISTLREVQFDQEARVLIFASKVEGMFCAGADLKERASMSKKEVQEFVFTLRSTFSSIQNLPVPTIAAIDGFALGGGAEIALACDMRVGGKNTVFGLPETSLAIIPGAGGTQRLPRIIGAAKAKELIFTCDRLDGAESHRIGLLNSFSTTQSPLDLAISLAKKIKDKGPIALRAAKIAIDVGMEMDISSGMKLEESCYQQVISTKDRLEGLAAFKEKRKPVYKGE
eukprot:c19956_g1_i1.p1 GENE.c19956_g1_i1~~c19956_g1_i1.p1  ORF type:complete len:331 (+),score=139.17 c19956_g1_i1:66-995(+)